MHQLKSHFLHRGAQIGYQKVEEKRWRSLVFHPLLLKTEQVLVMLYQKKSNALNVYLLRLKKYQNLVRRHASRYIDVWTVRNHLIISSVFK